MLRMLYNHMKRFASHRHAIGWMGLVSFLESFIFPLPPDIMLIPMILAKRHRAWLYAITATITSVIGGVFGYMIGYGLLDTIGQPILDFYGVTKNFYQFKEYYNAYGIWIILFASFTPFPYKIITITSGAFTLDLTTFIILSIVGRGLRFFTVCGLLYWFGPTIRTLIEALISPRLAGLFIIVLLLLFITLRYIF